MKYFFGGCKFIVVTVFALGTLNTCRFKHYQKMNVVTQLTNDTSGHYLNVEQCFSPDGRWIVYDTRNDGGQIGQTDAIKMVNVFTKEIKTLYTVANQNEYGPGVGAVACSPVDEKVIFIHGIRNANKEKPYSFSRRTGVSIKITEPNQPIFMDARDVTEPFTAGALRGGTHAHSWSADGQMISFTYNDNVIEELSKTNPAIKDLRNVGVMFSKGVNVVDDGSLENNSGTMFSVVIGKIVQDPKPGTDEIDKAFDECWIGKNGYVKANSIHQKRAIAFQGNVRDENSQIKTEIFVVDLPEELTTALPNLPLQGTKETFTNPPSGVVQRRISFTKKGVLGPRHWLKCSPDGTKITFLSKDDEGFVNAFYISPNGGDIKQLTFHKFNVQSGLSFSPDGNYVTYFADHAVYITHVESNKSQKLTESYLPNNTISGCPIWSPNGKNIAFNKYVDFNNELFVQIFLITIN